LIVSGWQGDPCYKKERRQMVVLVIGRVEGRYETQAVPFGEVYAWRSGRVVLECDCGEVVTFIGSKTVCSCGMNHAATVREELAAMRLEDDALHPWRYAREREGVGLPC
jgi:hypothetical protein